MKILVRLHSIRSDLVDQLKVLDWMPDWTLQGLDELEWTLLPRSQSLSRLSCQPDSDP